jgi:hypothetical protein
MTWNILPKAKRRDQDFCIGVAEKEDAVDDAEDSKCSRSDLPRERD